LIGNFFFVFAEGFKLLPRFVNYTKSSGSNRTSLDIVRDMLVVASTGVRKTKIMYQANLSYSQVKKYLRDLLNQGLLKHDGNSFYLITKKGLEFLELYDNYAELCMLIKEHVDQSARERLFLEKMLSGNEVSRGAECDK
jgi:predicted transcriptional regulator